jgi:hypothetical protein
MTCPICETQYRCEVHDMPLVASICRHPARNGVWCVMVTNPSTHTSTMLSTHSTRNAAVVSANQINQAEKE